MKLFKWLWIGVALLTLALDTWSFDPAARNNGALTLLVMGAISFPFGLHVVLAYLVMHEGFRYFPPNTLLTQYLTWLAFFIAGYVQWFLVAPVLWRDAGDAMRLLKVAVTSAPSHQEPTMPKGEQRSNKMSKKPKKDLAPPKEGSGTSDRPLPPTTVVVPRGKLKNKL